jgi:transposase
MRFIGLDLHKHSLEVCALDAKGKRLFRLSVDCDRQALDEFGQKHLRKTDKIALEATTNTWAVVEILRPFVAEVVVGNPLQIKAIAQAKVKTDKIDAEVLAHLLRCDYLPAVWQPDEATQRLRRLTTVRAGLVGDRTRLKNRVQCLLAQLLIEPPVNVLFTKQGLEWLRSVKLPADDRQTVDRYLRLYEAVEKELSEVEDQLMALAHKSEQAKLLMTLPGVAHGVAMSLIAALGDITRFKDGDHAASYLGLVPIVRQSGGKCYRGRITKAGCAQTRAMLTQAAQHAASHPGPVGAFFRRLRKRKSHNVAVTAVARKLVTIAYLMLKNNEPYRYAKPETVRTKFNEVRCKAGEPAPKKKKPEKPNGSQPIVGRLNATYLRSSLPAAKRPEQWSAGERRALAAAGVTTFAREVHTEPVKRPRIRPKTTTKTKTKS